MTTKAIRVYEIFKELGLKEEKAGEIVDLLTETAKEGVATKEDILHLEREITNLKVDMIKWAIGLLLGQTALIFTILRLFFTR